jgi:hypothetical protein
MGKVLSTLLFVCLAVNLLGQVKTGELCACYAFEEKNNKLIQGFSAEWDESEEMFVLNISWNKTELQSARIDPMSFVVETNDEPFEYQLKNELVFTDDSLLVGQYICPDSEIEAPFIPKALHMKDLVFRVDNQKLLDNGEICKVHLDKEYEIFKQD